MSRPHPSPGIHTVIHLSVDHSSTFYAHDLYTIPTTYPPSYPHHVCIWRKGNVVARRRPVIHNRHDFSTVFGGLSTREVVCAAWFPRRTAAVVTAWDPLLFRILRQMRFLNIRVDKSVDAPPLPPPWHSARLQCAACSRAPLYDWVEGAWSRQKCAWSWTPVSDASASMVSPGAGLEPPSIVSTWWSWHMRWSQPGVSQK